MADDVFKIRKRPKKDPLTWIRQGEYGGGDQEGESNIRGVTNRPLKELLENDLELLRYLEKALNLVSGVESSKLNQARHFDEMGSGLEHLDMTVSPSRRFYSPSEIAHQDHNDTNLSLHQDHTDHSDRTGVSETVHVDQNHQDQAVNIQHYDYTDHANTHGDHSDTLSRPHSDVPHTDHSDHQDYTSTGTHGDHNDHANAHGDNCYPSNTGCHLDHNDHIDYTNHTDCSTEMIPQMPGISCEPDGKHYDYYLHHDYPASYTYHYDGHSALIQCFGYCHDDHGDGFTHLDGRKEWFYSDLYNHGDYPPNHTDHSDSIIPNHTDHGDNSSSSHADHYDHSDYHLDHSDIVNTSENFYVNYTDHSDFPHSDIAHFDHSDHYDFHSDQATTHLDLPAHSDHLDSPEIKHSDHRDIPHEDGGAPHLDYTPSNTSYHLDYTPISSSYHYDNGDEHHDLSLISGAHLDRGVYSLKDLSEGIYEEVYKWVLHGDRSFHNDYDGHGDAEPGDQEHTDHSDIEFHEDHPHGDTPYQDYYGPGHLDRPPEQTTVHNDHLDGLLPQQLHADSISLQITSPHQDHVDTIHIDYHLDLPRDAWDDGVGAWEDNTKWDYPHIDNTGHADITNTVTDHIDYSHQDHSDHSDWDHEDHTDIDLVFGKWKYIVSYADHGDYTFHQDFPHSDGTGHLDYVPEHDDHGDHANLAHGDSTPTEPHIDYPHYDHMDIQSHSDGPRGPQHEDLYYHLDVPHMDRVEHTDRTTTG
jgi:hypothetical protein